MATAAAVVDRTNSKPRDTERRLRRRFRRVRKNRAAGANAAVGEGTRENAGPDPHPQVEVEYVPEKADLDVDDPLLGVFTAIFEKFSFTAAAAAKGEGNEKEVSDNAAKKKGSDVDYGEQDAPKKKKLQRMKIAELKQICNKPDVVEVWDATAVDPKLLVYLKSYRNTVPVPRHWSQKRKFLQGLL